MRVLIACEFSGTVRDAFIAKGHDAMSCDLEPTESPGPHYQGDVFDIINDGWDLMIAHPPCTHLAVSGARHFAKTCLWLKGLPLLKPTNIVEKGEFVVFPSGKRMSKWYADSAKNSPKERERIRNKTFQGIADAMAEQWG